ncbi:MAG: DUF423 domain-containing protein [Rhizobiaceae bacterium]|nr:DUF423 domain-containing protein [Rhizobiaceae bacterium]
MTADRIFAVLGGLFGAAGVALSAMAAHRGGAFIGTAATFLLAHAPVLLAIGLVAAGRPMRLATALLGLGVVLFCGDLLAREFLGGRLFPFAAPIGGSAMILGWLGIALAALMSPGGGRR